MVLIFWEQKKSYNLHLNLCNYSNYMDDHKRELVKLCRICGKNIPRGAKRWEKQKKRDLVLSCYTVDIASDSDDIHPPTICNGCYARMSRLSVSRGKNHYTPAEGIVTVWSPHTDSCFVCHAKSGVGRPAKSTKNRGRPPGETTNTIIAHIRVSAAPSVAMSVDTARICSSQVNPSHLTCAMCQCIADAPVALACGPLACCKCLIELLLSDGPATHCGIREDTKSPSFRSRWWNCRRVCAFLLHHQG